MGRVVDLSARDTNIADPIAVDANVVVARLLASYLGQHPLGATRARLFFDSLIARGGTGVVTPTAFNLVANNLIILGPDDLGPIASGLSYDREIVRLVGRYGLDTSDTAILLEAQRIDQVALVTLDHDTRRAAIDFDVYTWL